jgi:cellulose synthase/poly-beta-1,6-N-acetylglucosamine synthase-like glycosyltransferase
MRAGVLVGLLLCVLLSLVQVILAVGLAYYYGLLLAALLGRRGARKPRPPAASFAIAIPAHDEETVIGRTVSQLKKQEYPTELFDVYVVADHCSDRTARVAREHGAICHERTQGPRGRKAFAVQWLLGQILDVSRDYDALVVFDADSRVDPGFLRAMNDALAGPRSALQGRHVIVEPEGHRFSGLAAVDMRLNNLLRNRAKHNLGLSCRVMGDAMCFAFEVIREHGWPSNSLTEDREYGLYLLTQGIRVGYVPQAVSHGQAAPGWKEASAQRLRWYGGVLHIRRRYAFRLLEVAIRRRDVAALDQAIELLLPSFSTLALLSICVCVVQCLWTLSLLFPRWASVAQVMAWVAFPLLGLWVAGAPAAAYRALCYSPIYLAWRLWVGLCARLLPGRVPWVRTPRREETGRQGTSV